MQMLHEIIVRNVMQIVNVFKRHLKHCIATTMFIDKYFLNQITKKIIIFYLNSFALFRKEI